MSNFKKEAEPKQVLSLLLLVYLLAKKTSSIME